jgi:ornithine cyclodeaminase/alanine dehydrogenase-like protein (mu-crystallin family)
VINGDAIKPGCTVISNTPEELDHTTVRRADKIVVTTVEDIIGHMPPWQGVQDLLDNGELTPDDVSCGIGDIIVGRRPGRTSDDEIIVGVNPGNGIHDVAAGKFVYDRAVALGLGTELPV